MAKTKISEFDVDPSNNTDINSINIAEGCAPSGINNAIRQLMSDLKEQQTGASGDNFTVGGNLAVTGTSVFTGATTFSGAVVFSSAPTGLGLGNMSTQNKTAVDITGGTIAAGTLKSVALTAALGATEALAGTASQNSTAAITQIDAAITAVNTEAATHGAFQNKLGFVTDNLSSLIQTTSAAKSRIMDTDFAAQTAQLSKYQILQQAGTAMLAQANQMGSNVLTLLK
jgi:flagellin